MRNNGVLASLFKYMGVFKSTMALSIVLAAVAAVINLSAYICVYNVAGEIVGSMGDFSTLNHEYLAEMGWRATYLIGMSFGLSGMSLLFSHITAYNTVAKLRIKLLRHIGALPLGYHSVNPSGKQRKIIEKNTDNLETIIAHQIPDFVQSLVLPIAFTVFMFMYDWRLSLICLLPIVIGFAVLASMLKGAGEGLAKQYQKSAEKIGNSATEYVRGISVVKVFGQTASSFKRYKDAVKEYSDYVIKYALSMENSDSIYNVVINGIFFFLIPAGIVLYNFGVDTQNVILSFIFFAVLIPAVVSILNKIMKSSSNLMVAKSSLDAMGKIFEEKPLPQTTEPKMPRSCDIILENVTFAYEENSENALKNVSIEIKEGTTTALVGESGSGKSTVANLVARFWDVDDGCIKIGGIDLREMDYAGWMRQVSIVFQETSLLKMSIAENVAFYKQDATKEEILRALNLAMCDDILAKLPSGVDTVIGTKGVYLSGGEMQRIALARAILKDAPIVILDEATAFADAQNEHLIKQALDKLLKGKTVLMIAHRLSTIIHADQICVLDKGKVVERGTHTELLAMKGKYSDMFIDYSNSISWKIGGEKRG